MALSRERLVPLIVAVALFMENMDANVIATSLPAIAQDLGTSPLTLKLAVTSYLLSLAVFIPASGWTADRFGARNVFRIAIGVFMTGSLICATATSVAHLIAGRIVEGMGAAMMAPVARLLILRTVDKHSLVDAMSLLTVPGLMGPLLGPPVGGFITTYFTWHWIFLINLPIGIVGILLVTRFVEDVRVDNVSPIDLPGLILCAIAVAGLAFGLSVAGFDILPWSVVTALMTGGAVAALAYFMHARHVAAPALDFSLMALVTFRASVLGGSVFRIGIGAMPFLLPLLFQLGFGFTPLQSGLVTFTSAMGALIVKAFAKRIVVRFGFRRVLIGNALIASAFIAACALIRPSLPFALIIAILLVGGFFRSLEFTCINALSFADVEPARMSRATTMSAVWQQLSLSTGVALGAFIVEYTLRWKRNATISPDDFLFAFLIIGAVSAISAALFMRLPQDAGAQLSAAIPMERKERSSRNP
ncbi:MAG TPA: MFS transporter [Xanthobacteraceae bacterium]|nr:MFS transporter [Xanthobacteraceae bacterium]